MPPLCNQGVHQGCLASLIMNARIVLGLWKIILSIVVYGASAMKKKCQIIALKKAKI